MCSLVTVDLVSVPGVANNVATPRHYPRRVPADISVMILRASRWYKLHPILAPLVGHSGARVWLIQLRFGPLTLEGGVRERKRKWAFPFDIF